jgi:hypothetical protein
MRYFAALLTVGVVMIAACGCTTAADSGSPEATVQQLLELRAGRSTDASAYAELLESVDLAIELADTSGSEDVTSPPTPAWEEPFVAAEESSTVDVVVVWIPDDTFPEWPVATVFITRETSETWSVVDAEEIYEDAEIPDPLE